MKKQQYDCTLLLQRIDSKFEDVNKFCDHAGLDPVKFLEAVAESDLSASTIKICIELLEIPSEDIERYFFTPLTEYVARRGRPFKAIQKTTTPPENNRYYTIDEASKLLGLHRHTLQARLRDKTIKGKLIGREWRIYRDELFDNSSYIYFFDCLDGYFGEKYLTPCEIDRMENHSQEPVSLKEGQIIEIARNLEAVLYRCKDTSGTDEVCIYDCMDI